MTILFESAIRVTLIAAVIALVLFAMRIKTASVLHAVWASVVVLMMLLPAWVAWGPKASLPVLPPQATAGLTPLVDVPPPLPAGLEERSPSPVREDGGFSLLGVYLLGASVLLLRLAIGTVRANRLTSASCVVPVTVGLLRPRVILPDSSRGWPQAQLDAVLAHEGEHLRRRDPLFQWLALLNRALFWFHPLAWWLERKLSGLAEEACDAAVLSRGYDPRAYSEYLLDLARSVRRAGTRVNAVGMAMPGIGLAHRIRQMLSGVQVPRISRPRMACTIAVCAAAAAIFAAGTLVRAQSSKSNFVAFEVASVKHSSPDGILHAGMQILPGGKFTARNTPLRLTIAAAYDLPFQSGRLTGGPDWISEGYDIDAIAPPGSIPTGVSLKIQNQKIRLMLQTLLADRFKLITRRETKDLPVYAVVVARNGPKLTKAKVDEKACQDGSASEVRCHQFSGGQGRGLHGEAVDMDDLVLFVENWTDKPVVNKTSLKGLYKIETDGWLPMRLGQTVGPNEGLAEADRPTLFKIFEQLGLKLEPRNAPIEMFRIESIERPSEN